MITKFSVQYSCFKFEDVKKKVSARIRNDMRHYLLIKGHPSQQNEEINCAVISQNCCHSKGHSVITSLLVKKPRIQQLQDTYLLTFVEEKIDLNWIDL